MSDNLQYWNKQYAQNEVPNVPSQFAAFVANELERHERNIVDLGCGNARDAVFFYGLGKNVLGLDGSKTVIRENAAKYSHMSSMLTFREFDLNSDKSVSFLLPENCAVYCRFFIHAIDRMAEKNLFILLNNNFVEGQRIFFEFRTEDDKDLLKIAEKHYRRYINIADFSNLLEQNQFEINYSISGKGFAKYKSEDAHVCRIIATKKLAG